MEDQVETEAKNFAICIQPERERAKTQAVNGILGDRPRLPIGVDLEFTALLNGGFARRKQWQLVSWSGEQSLRQQGTFLPTRQRCWYKTLFR